MINLLPPNYSQQIKYGRVNAVLVRWLVVTLLAIGGLLIIIFSGWLYINSQSKNLQRNIDDSKKQLQAQHLEQVQKQAAEITGDIKVINQVLSREIRFSDLMQEVGKTLPPGTVLGALTLNKVTGALDLSANAKDYSSAAQIAVNLNDPKNGLFDKVDIININCGTDTIAYKCNATFKALFNKSAQNRFLSVPKADKP
jgi:Tfp pilus assembly protein PilN